MSGYKKYLQDNGFKGCSNHGCIINTNTVGTNGRCQCLDLMHKAERGRLFYYMAKFSKIAEEQTRLSTLRECAEIVCNYGPSEVFEVNSATNTIANQILSLIEQEEKE